jgi:hypothetical protein
VRILIAFFGALLVACPASAQETAPAPSGHEDEYTNEQLSVRVRSWYGWQTLAIDVAALATGVTGYAVNNGSGNPVGTIGILGYLFGPPIVHWIHGHAGRGAADLGLRFLGPIAVGGLGYLLGLPAGTNSNGDPVGSQIAGGIGLGVGYIVVVTLDAAVFAYEAKLETSPPAPAALFVPRVQLRQGGATFGLIGAF